jgi:phosphoglycolate phosphatase-like HAD superfamily hydrolase
MKGASFIFDVEGTLIDCVPDTLSCWQKTLAEFGITIPFAALQRLSGMDGNDMLETLIPQAGRQERNDILAAQDRRYRADCLPQARAFGGVRELFEAVRNCGARIALATDCKSDELRHYRSLMQVDDLIDAIACGDDVDTGKPAPDLIELALQRLGNASAIRATMIGDTPFDAQAARHVGAKAWGTLGGGHTRSSLMDAGCSVVAASLQDFEAYLLRHAEQV